MIKILYYTALQNKTDYKNWQTAFIIKKIFDDVTSREEIKTTDMSDKLYNINAASN